MNSKYSIGGAINSNGDILPYLEKVEDVLTELEKKRNVRLKYNLDIVGQEKAERLLEQFDEKSRNGMNDYFVTQKKGLRDLENSYEDLLSLKNEIAYVDEADKPKYQQKIDKLSNSIVRQANAYKALGYEINENVIKKVFGSMDAESLEDKLKSFQEVMDFAKNQEKVLQKKSDGYYQYTEKNFKELFDIMKELDNYLEDSTGLSKNFFHVTPMIEDLKELEKEAQKAEEYISKVYEKYGSWDLDEGTQSRVIKARGTILGYYKAKHRVTGEPVTTSEAFRNVRKMNVPSDFEESSIYRNEVDRVMGEYYDVLAALRKKAQKEAEAAQEEMVSGLEGLLKEKDSVIELITRQVDSAKKKISYLKIEQQKKLASEWGTFEGARPKFAREEDNVPGAYLSNTAFTEASNLYETLLDQIEQGAISADDAITLMAEHLFKAVTKGEATPFLSDDVIAMQEEIEALKNKVLELQEALKRAGEEADNWMNYSSGMFSDKLGLEDKIDELLKKIEDQEREIEELKNALEMSEHNVFKLKEENDELREQNDDLQWRGGNGYGSGYGNGYGNGYGSYDDDLVKSIQRGFDTAMETLSNSIFEFTNQYEQEKLAGEGAGQGGGKFSDCCEALKQIETTIKTLDLKALSEFPTFASGVTTILNTISSAVTNINAIISKGNGTLAITNVTNIGGEEDPALRNRYKLLYDAVDALAKTKTRRTLTYRNASEINEYDRELDELYARQAAIQKINLSEISEGQQFQLKEEIKYVEEAIETYERLKRESLGLDAKEVLNKVSGKVEASSLDAILMAIYQNLSHVAKNYSSANDFQEAYSLTTIEGLPLGDRVDKLEKLLGWIRELAKVKVGNDLDPVLRKAVKGFPAPEEQTTQKPQLGFSDILNQILETLQEVSRKVSQIANALNTEAVNDIPNLNAQFLTDRGQVLKDLFGRIATTKAGISQKASNRKPIEDFLKQFNAYGNGEWDLDEFARINNISKKSLEILKQYNEELFGQKETVEKIADKEEEIKETVEEKVLSEVSEKQEETIPALKTEEKVLDNILEKEKEITKEKEKQEEITEEIAKEEEKKNIKKPTGEPFYLTDKNGNVQKWYRGTYGDIDAGAFVSERYGGGSFWINNPMLAAGYGGWEFPQRIHETTQSAYRPFLLDAKGRNWNDLVFFGVDEQARKLEEDYAQASETLKRMGVNTDDIDTRLLSVIDHWDEVFDLLMSKYNGEIDSVANTMEKNHRSSDLFAYNWLDDITLSEVDLNLLSSILNRNGLVNSLKGGLKHKTADVVKAAEDAGIFDTIIFKDILDIGGGGNLSLDGSKEDLLANIVVQLDPSNINHLRTAPATEFLDEAWVKHLIEDLFIEFDSEFYKKTAMVETPTGGWQTVDLTKDVKDFRKTLQESDASNAVLSYFMSLPDEVSQQILDILNSEEVDASHYPAEISKLLTDRLLRLLEKDEENFVENAFKLLKEIDDGTLDKDEDYSGFVTGALKHAKSDFKFGNKDMADVWLDTISNSFTDVLKSKEKIMSVDYNKGIDVIQSIMSQQILKVWSDYNQNKEQYEMPEIPKPEVQEEQNQVQEKTIENLEKEKELRQEVNDLVEEKNELTKEDAVNSNDEEAIENLKEQKALQQELNDIVEQKNELGKEEAPIANIDTETKEETAIGEVVEEINNKTEAFQHEQEVVSEVVSAERKELNKLKKRINEVTEAVKEKTAAFEEEGMTAGKVVSQEGELRVTSIVADTINGVQAGQQPPEETLLPAIQGVYGLSTVSEEARESINSLGDSYERFSIALRDGQGDLQQTADTIGQMSQVASNASQAMAQNGPVSSTAAAQAADLEEATLKYLKAIAAFDNLMDKVPDKFMNYELHFSDVLGQSESRTIEQAVTDLNQRVAAINQMPNDALKGEEMEKLTPILTKYTSVINEFLKSRDLLADSLSMKKIKNNIQDYLSNNTNLTEEQRDKFIRLREAIESAFDPAGNNISMTKDELKEIIGEVEETKQAVKQAGNEGHNTLYKVSQQVAHLNEKWVGQLLSFHDIIRYIRTMYTEIKNIDSALIELKKVTDGLTMERLDISLENSFDTARKLGSEVTEVINTTADWARLGYGIEDAEKLAEITTLFRNVGDNMTTDTASEYLISTLKGFEMVPEEALGIVDKFNEVANNFAIDTAGIGQALERSSASFNAANTSLSESIALVTTANAVVQNPESVGTTFKTLSARIRGAKTELEELGEEEDDFTKSTSKLRDLVKGMTGFDIMEDENTFKSIYEILLGIGKEWDKLTDVERASLGEALAGKRNSNVLYAIMNNIDDLEKAYEMAENAAGSATREQENYQKSIQYSVDVMKAELSELYTKVLNSDTVKKFVDLLAEALSYVVKIADKVPTIAVIGSMFGASALLGNSKRMGNLGMFFDAVVKATNVLVNQGGSSAWQTLISSILKIQTNSLGEGETTPATELLESLQDPQQLAESATQLASIAGIITAVTVTVWALSKAIDSTVDSVADIENRMAKASENIQKYDSKIAELNERLEEINNLDMSSYSETQQQNLKDEAEQVKNLAKEYEYLKTTYEEGYAKDREKLWWGEQKETPQLTFWDQLFSGDIKGAWATHRSSGIYRGDSAALQYLLNELIPTSSVGMFIPKKEENKSELLDEAMKKYDKYDEKITKSREKQLDYAKKINKEQSTQWDYEQDEFFSQQRVLDYQRKIDKEDQKRLDYDAERSDALDEILERQSELLEMKSEYENKPIQFQTEEDALKLNRVNEELTKIDEFLGDRLPKEIEKTTDEATESVEEVKNAFSDIGALLSQDDWVLERSSERYKVLEREYAKELELAKKAGAEVDRAIYGNVNLDDRDVIEWSWDKLGKYKDAIESWGGTVEELAGSVSTVMGTSAEFDGVEIAFTPMLQTPTGPELLDADTVYKYIDTLISQMPEGWTTEDLLKLDSEGLEIEGKKIKGLIAEVGDEATRVAETMHFHDSLKRIKEDMDELEKSSDFWSDVKDDLYGMAQAGKLDADTFKDYKYFNEILEALGIEASKADEEIQALIDDITRFANNNIVDRFTNAKSEADNLNNSYQKFISGEFIDASTLNEVQDTFAYLGESYREFEEAVMSGEEDLQPYFDKIITQYVAEEDLLGRVTEETADWTEQNLINLGVTEESAKNAVKVALANKKALESGLLEQTQKLNNEKLKLNEYDREKIANAQTLDDLDIQTITNIVNETLAMENLDAETQASTETLALYVLQKALASGMDLSNPEDFAYLEGLINATGIATDAIKNLINAKELNKQIDEINSKIDEVNKKYEGRSKGYEYAKEVGPLQQEVNRLVNQLPGDMTDLANQATKDFYEAWKKEDPNQHIELNYGGIVDDAEKAGSDAGAAFKDALDKILAMYDAELDAGVIAFKDYVNKSRGIIEQYYKDGKITAAEYYDYIASLYEKQVSEYDKVINAVQRRIKEEVESLEKQKETIEESYSLQIEEIQKKIDALQEENEEIDRNLALSKAQYELARQQNQRTKLMYSESRGFYYEADLKGIAEAQENVRKAQLDKTVSELQRKITQLQESMKKETDEIDEQIKSLNELSEAWGEVSSTLEREIEDQRAIEIIGQNWEEQILNEREKTLEDFTNAYVELQRKQKDAYLEARRAEAEAAVNNAGNGGSGNGGTYTRDNNNKDVYDPYNPERKYYYDGQAYPTITEAEAAKQADIRRAGEEAYQKAYSDAMEKHKNDPIPDVAKKGLAEKAAREAREAAENRIKNRQIKAAFSGTDSAKPGETLVGELGSEIVLHKNGTASVVDSPTLMNMKGGEKVFNAEETEKILKSKYVPLKKFNPKKFAMLHAFANGTSSPMQSMIAAQAVGIANGLNKGLIATSSTGGQTINQTFNVSLPNITDSSKATELFREFEQLQRKATQFFN